MNMFRNLLSLALFIFALGLFLGHPDKWTWVDAAGANAVYFIRFCITFKPFVAIGCIVAALALFMTRKQY